MSLQADPADLFAQLYDRMDVEELRDPQRIDEWLNDPELRELSSETEEEALRWGLDPSEIEESIGGGEPKEKRILAHLLGLERALRFAHPVTGTHSPNEIARITLRYARTGRFSTAAIKGAVLPRFAFPREVVTPTRLPDFFTDLLRVSPEAWDKASHVMLPSIGETFLDAESGRLKIGCAPLLRNLDDLHIEPAEGNPGGFRIHPKDKPELHDAIAEILSALDESGAQLGLMPESSVSKPLLDTWVSAIRGSPPPENSCLDWVLVGSGPVGAEEPPANRAVLLERRTGRILCTQDKMFPFVLTPDQLKSWGLRDLLGKKTVQEEITVGNRISIIESSLGRVAVLICEDLSRVTEVGPVLRAHGVSLVLSPVLADELQDYFWEHVKARDYAQEIGTRTVVANSLAIPGHQGKKRANVFLGVWPVDYKLEDAEDRTDVVVLEIPLLDPLPPIKT